MLDSLPQAVGDLLAWIEQQPDGMPFVHALPQQLRDPEIMTVADSRGLIEFGRPVYINIGGKLRIERGFEFGSITGPGRIALRAILAKDEQCEHAELRLRVRVTGAGRVALAEHRVGKSLGNLSRDPGKPMSGGQKQVWDLLENCALTGSELVKALKQRGVESSDGMVRQHIHNLKQTGFAVENRRGRGYYRLDAPPPDMQTQSTLPKPRQR